VIPESRGTWDGPAINQSLRPNGSWRSVRPRGSAGLSFERPDEAMTGYVLAKDAWRNGYATEALQAMVDVSRSIGLARIYALCHSQHRASRRVLEKCRFAHDESWSQQAQFPNLAPGVLQDVVRYELIFGRSEATRFPTSGCSRRRSASVTSSGAFERRE
jgi:RimJ/RimL family protein N-acetyltransferase